MNQKVKIGVVGAGVFGGYHAQKCAANVRAEFIGIYDPKIAASAAITARLGGQSFNDYDVFFKSCEAVIIASPARSHGDMAARALQAGCHCLIEKPIAHNLEQAQRIIDLAKRQNKIVQIGHQERFVIKAIGLDKIAERPRLINSYRMCPFSVRGTDVSVTLDLMTHDLDLAALLMGDV